MSGTTNLNAPYITAAQNQKETTANTAFDRLDKALTETLDISLTSGSATPTAEQVRAASRIALTGATTAGRTLTLPAVKRHVLVGLDASSTKSVGIVRGSTTITILPGERIPLYADGTTNHLVATAQSNLLRPHLWVAGAPADAEVLFSARVPAGQTWTLLPDLLGWDVVAKVAATGSTVFDILRGVTLIGTLTWSASGTTATLATDLNVAQSLAAGQELNIVGEGTADATLADIMIGMAIVRS